MNVATEAMNRLTNMLKAVDGKFDKFTTEPYGVRKATPKEQMQMYQNMSEADMYKLIQEHGIDEVNKWAWKMQQRSNNG